MEYCRKLGFDEKPDYSYLRRLFRDLFFKSNYECDFTYDWMLKKRGATDSDKIPKVSTPREKGGALEPPLKSPGAKVGSPPGKKVELGELMEEEKKPVPVERTTAGVRGATTKAPTAVGSSTVLAGRKSMATTKVGGSKKMGGGAGGPMTLEAQMKAAAPPAPKIVTTNPKAHK